jgi:hypothetical protein
MGHEELSWALIGWKLMSTKKASMYKLNPNPLKRGNNLMGGKLRFPFLLKEG